ncbi:MAG: peptidase M3 [Planctomycetota bacterium]|nr:MAG: peptidase M3 [Planctomycetota bacterium]
MKAWTPDGLQVEVRARIGEARERLERFLLLSGEADFLAVIAGFDGIRRPLDAVSGLVSLFAAVHPDKALRDRAEVLEQELVAFETELSLNRAVYERLVLLSGAEAPGDDEARLLERALRDFRRSGVDQDDVTRDRIRALQDELVEVGQQFDRNIVEGRRSIRIAEGHAGLAGLPADYLVSHPEDEDGSVTITTDAPDYVPFMMYAERGDLRTELYFEYGQRAHPVNLPVLSELLAKRFELARLLGYDNWAHYATEDKMVKSAGAVREFIERISERARPKAEREVAELLEEKRKLDPGATDVRLHELFFLRERVKRSRYGFDSQSVRPYFAYERVQQGILATSAALYGVQFAPCDSVPVWHPSVECFELLEHGEPVARVYFDMFPREGKYKHAAMFGIHQGGEGRLPEAALVCNFPEPKDGEPALLLHSQVTTFFHEVGHLLHHLFAGRQRYLKFSGISTEWDFVEVPSQMYEEWAWDAGVLREFATHHETGERIPEQLVGRLRAAEEYGKGITVRTQMCFAMISLAYYDRDPAGLDTTAAMIELKARMAPFPHDDGTYFQASFGHLHGYSALYYTYMWSLVIAKDLYGPFAGDLMNTATANRYRAAILDAGGARDADELVRSFLGRDYGIDAWEAWLEE